MIEYRELFLGIVDGAEVRPREVTRCNAAANIVTHNHPSGAMDGCAADRAVTAWLKQALALVEVRMIDHTIVGGGTTTSAGFGVT